ncbi:LPS export ABC transporter permease LptG [Mesobaculum littorinae]|uniref:LPS export ABC transporter permease LptG n=1 Tax=Mesobaculum littorinae TaxID=2486419 RepID=A0A438AK06_9RHOB|nr:LPS export ABC transporter permease LptG [Mesobaculum littorinae]RVV98935.1 LPS export ABC transporter permease LptG [Mesobaculum littorinae]
MTLHLYFARRFLGAFLGVFAAFAALLALIDLVEQIRRFDSATVSFRQKVGLTLLHIPDSLYRILPLVMILATLWLFLSLARTSELVVTRAAGRSALRSLAGPVTVALVIGVTAVGVLNPIVAASSARYDVLASRYASAFSSILSLSGEGLWLRQGGPEGQTVIEAPRANLDGTELYGATFLGFDTAGMPTFRIEAARAELTPGEWHLRDVKLWRLDAENPEAAAERQDQMTLPATLSRDQILDSFGAPQAIPVWDLPAFISRLEEAGFSARRHRVWLQMELALPVLLVAMVLVGAGFTMRHTRMGRTGLMVLFALGLGFALYFIRDLAQILGETGQIPIALAAWGPPVAAILLPLGLLLHWEDG